MFIFTFIITIIVTAVRICCIIWCFLCVISLSAEAQKEKYFEKNVRFPEKITLEEKVEIAARLVPTKQQLAWQQLELTAFIHFGINTFTGKEQGDGKEFPVMFNPVRYIQISGESFFSVA